MKNGLMQLNNNTEAYIAKLLGMPNTEPPVEPTNLIEEFLNLLLENGGVIPRESLVEYALDGLESVIDPNENKIYLIPATETEENNLFEEYVYKNGQWERFGKATVLLKIIDDLKASNSTTYSSEKSDSKFIEMTTMLLETTAMIVDCNLALDEHDTKINANATEIAKTNTIIAPLIDSIIEQEKQIQALTDRIIALEPPVEEEEVVPPVVEGDDADEEEVVVPPVVEENEEVEEGAGE